MEVALSHDPDCRINSPLSAFSWLPLEKEYSWNIRERIVTSLRSGILSGAFLPGEELSEAKLGKIFDASRTSIREAVRYLESERLITIRRNRRMYVTVVRQDEVAAIYRLLGLLVSEAIANLASTRNNHFMALIYDAQAKLKAAALASEILEICTVLSYCYGLIVRCSEHVLTSEIVEKLCARIGFLRSCAMKSGDRGKLVVMEFCAIITALERRDAELARRASISHFNAENQAVAKLLSGSALQQSSIT
jgi:DNA-binding GntR family transcriptional regulator